MVCRRDASASDFLAKSSHKHTPSFPLPCRCIYRPPRLSHFFLRHDALIPKLSVSLQFIEFLLAKSSNEHRRGRCRSLSLQHVRRRRGWTPWSSRIFQERGRGMILVITKRNDFQSVTLSARTPSEHSVP